MKSKFYQIKKSLKMFIYKFLNYFKVKKMMKD